MHCYPRWSKSVNCQLEHKTGRHTQVPHPAATARGTALRLWLWLQLPPRAAADAWQRRKERPEQRAAAVQAPRFNVSTRGLVRTAPSEEPRVRRHSARREEAPGSPKHRPQPPLRAACGPRSSRRARARCPVPRNGGHAQGAHASTALRPVGRRWPAAVDAGRCGRRHRRQWQRRRRRQSASGVERADGVVAGCGGEPAQPLAGDGQGGLAAGVGRRGGGRRERLQRARLGRQRPRRIGCRCCRVRAGGLPVDDLRGSASRPCPPGAFPLRALRLRLAGVCALRVLPC
jgi:hypothetical protein